MTYFFGGNIPYNFPLYNFKSKFFSIIRDKTTREVRNNGTKNNSEIVYCATRK